MSISLKNNNGREHIIKKRILRRSNIYFRAPPFLVYIRDEEIEVVAAQEKAGFSLCHIRIVNEQYYISGEEHTRISLIIRHGARHRHSIILHAGYIGIAFRQW